MKTLEDIIAAATEKPTKGRRELVLPVSGKFCQLRSSTLEELRTENHLRKNLNETVALTWLLDQVMILEGHTPGTALSIHRQDLLEVLRTLAELALEILSPDEGEPS